MARMNISVPDELKARMDEITESNWSRVAQDAFEHHLLKRTSTMETTDIEGVATRLRASKQLGEKEDAELGQEAGHEWAMKTAEYHELQRVVLGSDFQYPYDKGMLATVVGMAALDQTKHDRDDSEIQDFWEEAVGTGTPTDVVVTGFHEGAVEVWNEVIDKV